MSKKRTTFSTEFKTKIVLEVLKGDKTINEISSANNITPKNIQNWKNAFLANAEMAMEPSRAVQEYKDEIDTLKAKNDEYAKALGKVTIERDWLQGKLKSIPYLEGEVLKACLLHGEKLQRCCGAFAHRDMVHSSRGMVL